MSNDLVTRLRACWCHDAFSDRGLVDPLCDHDGIREEAADEIEKLCLLGDLMRNVIVNVYDGKELPEDASDLLESWEAMRNSQRK